MHCLAVCPFTAQMRSCMIVILVMVSTADKHVHGAQEQCWSEGTVSSVVHMVAYNGIMYSSISTVYGTEY